MSRRLAALLPALCALPLLAFPVAGQQPLALELRGGVGLPAFDLADRADPGPAVGLDLSYRIAPRLSVVAGGDVELLQGDELRDRGPRAPDLNVWHYGAGLEAQLLDPRLTYWRLSLGAGAGGTTFDASGSAGSETDVSVYGSLELGWEASREVVFFAGLDSWVAFAGSEAVGAGGGGSDALWSFPVTGGVRLTF